MMFGTFALFTLVSLLGLSNATQDHRRLPGLTETNILPGDPFTKLAGITAGAAAPVMEGNTKTVIYFRHTESTWNQAEKRVTQPTWKDFVFPLLYQGWTAGRMALATRTKDAGPSEKGRRASLQAGSNLQGMSLYEKLSGDDVKVWSSPLTRAVVTGYDMLTNKSKQTMFINPNLREKVSNKKFGPQDSMYERQNLLESYKKFGIKNTNVFGIELLTEDVTTPDEDDQLANRQKNFLEQLIQSPQKNHVVFGHSHWFMHLGEIFGKEKWSKPGNCDGLMFHFRKDNDKFILVDGMPITVYNAKHPGQTKRVTNMGTITPVEI